ncbi:MAG: beta-galactosidase [Pseudopedobacter saltans]|uniref:Beta-galactosidase n=1 Tax=Pseudopedobacter saltans TaxID=151895 RepID=A0A2W5GA79_9SPHI|nr:MAG: beta-galactosidase [Pseudopedobacter saltans]
MIKRLILASTLFLSSFLGFAQKAKHSFEIKDGSFVYDGKPIMLHAGEMHFARIPHQYWRHRLKMIKAMGLNAVTTYIFWNWHETAPGVWDFKGDKDLRQFVKEAGEEGLMVLLRPGPYTCGEWEFGGYPWWLPKAPGMVIRADNQPFLDSCKNYIGKVMEQVKDLQITHGGPIIMVQAENEFGSYVRQRPDVALADHKRYNAKIKQLLVDAGVDVPFYTADAISLFEGGSIPGVVPGSDGDYNAKEVKAAVNKYHGGKGPYMVAEYYPGWLDHWAEPFPKSSAQSVAKQLRKFIMDTMSFNIYMIHGGTNFGFTSGANYDAQHDIQPDMTSYDYDAPISEPGWVTPKYDSIRNLLQANSAVKLPAVPAKIPVIDIPAVTLTKAVNLFDITESMTPVSNDTLMSFEDLNQGSGYVLYSRKFTQPASGKLSIPGLRDFAVVYINGKKVGVLNRYYKKYDMEIDIPFNSTLQILVENMGRINYGAEIIHNTKGIIQPITIAGNEITDNWEMTQLPMSKAPDVSKLSNTKEEGVPVIYQGSFTLNKTGDTFLDMRGWGKGIVFVNGINLGRYWSTVGPQLTLYLPGCWLKKGKNDVVIFEQLNDKPQPKLSFTTTPILDQLIKQ